MRTGPKKERDRRRVEEIPVHRSSGNVFEDLGVAESAEALTKAELATQISALIEERGLSQVEAATILGVDQPGVSDLVRGRLRRFSTDRLFRFLTALGRDIEIVIRPHRSRRPGTIRVRGGKRRAVSAAAHAKK